MSPRNLSCLFLVPVFFIQLIIWVDSGWKVGSPKKTCGIVTKKEKKRYSYQKRKKKRVKLSVIYQYWLVFCFFVLFFRSHQSLGNSNGCPSTSSLSLHTHHRIMRSSWHPNYYSVLESPLFIWLVILGSSWRSSFDKALKRKHSFQFTPLAFFLLLTLASTWTSAIISMQKTLKCMGQAVSLLLLWTELCLSPNSSIEVLTPKGMVFGDEDFGR